MRADSLTLDQLLENFTPEHSSWVAIGKRIGGEALEVVLDELGGQHTHVPTAEYFRAALFRTIRDADIRARFRGTNYDELSTDYDITPRQIRRIVHGNNKGAE